MVRRHDPSHLQSGVPLVLRSAKSRDENGCRDDAEMETQVRIAQIAPLVEAVPPKLYGGTERVVSWLSDELVAQGHEVTLFASADSVTSARLVPCVPRGLRLAGVHDHTPTDLVMLHNVRRMADQFDVIHFHTHLLQHAMFADLAHKCVTTVHGRLDLPALRRFYRAFRDIALVSISDAQRRPLSPDVNWLATVYHGLSPAVCPFRSKGGKYLAFLGRISAEKRPDRAIEIAKRAGVPLKIAAKVDYLDVHYFEEVVKPLLDHPLVEFIGEIGEDEKGDFLGNALALLFPIDWPEPFGLVMIEAMSAGTPVIASPCGSVPEVIEDGVTGIIVHSIDQAVGAVDRVRGMSRYRVRQGYEARFTAARMATDYVAAYETLRSGAVRRPHVRPYRTHDSMRSDPRPRGTAVASWPPLAEQT